MTAVALIGKNRPHFTVKINLLGKPVSIEQGNQPNETTK